MSISLHKDTHGRVRFVLIVLVLLVIGGIGFAATRLLKEDAKPEKKEEKSQIECISDDKTICKFITSWKPSNSYRFTVEETSGGVTTKTIYDYDLNNPDKIHTTVEGSNPYEVISIGDTVYTKAGDTWWKETIEHGTDENQGRNKDDDSSQDYQPVKPTQYTAAGKEACGRLQCYKYQVNDPENTEIEQFIWFDDKEYKLRKLSFETVDTLTIETYDYRDVTINAPSPVEELGPNQQITPGDLAPVDI